MSELLIVEKTDSNYTVVHAEGRHVSAVRRLLLDGQHVLNSLDRIDEGDAPRDVPRNADWPHRPNVLSAVSTSTTDARSDREYAD
jgi:hypothetical protein